MSKKAQVRAVIYARVSLDRTGEELSVTTQEADALKLAKDRGWIVTDKFIDNSVSAKGTVKRDKFTAMMAAIRAGQVDVVIARHLDRLSRNGRDRLALTEACKTHGVTIALTHGSDIDMTTAGGRFTMGILGEVAQHEIELKSERQKRAERARAESGKAPVKGHRAYGYELGGKIIPAEKRVVQRIFARFLATDNIRGVARELQDAGIPTRGGKPWHPATIRSILTNPRYAGRVVYDGTVLKDVEAQWKPIIKPEQFDLVQARLSDPMRRTTRGSTARAHLGSGLYRCDACGEKVSVLGGRSYQCRTPGHVSRSRGPVDQWVVMVITKRLRRADLTGLLDGAGDSGITDLMNASENIRTRIALVDEEYLCDLIDARLHRAKVERLQAELSETEHEMTQRATGAAAAAVLAAGDPAAAFGMADLATQRAVIGALCTVRLRKHVRGSNTFDPSTVVIEWHR